MFNVLIGIIVGSIAKTWMQLAGATVIVVAVLTLVTNFAYNTWLLSKAGDAPDRPDRQSSRLG